MLPVASAIAEPATTPTVCAIASQPPIAPRWRLGTWSGTVAVIAASIAFSAAWASAQPRAIARIDCACESTSIATTPPTNPPRTHGRRRPTRSTVRSENAPHTGFSTVETRAPLNSTIASAVSLCAGSIASACWASSTWIGPKKPDQTPMLISESHSTQTLLTARGRLGEGAVQLVAHPRLAAITSEYQSKERFGVRTRVS